MEVTITICQHHFVYHDTLEHVLSLLHDKIISFDELCDMLCENL